MKKIFLLIIFLNVFFIKNVFSDFVIYEIMPNTDNDSTQEYVIIKNNWDSWKSLKNYILSDKAEKQFIFWDDFLESWSTKKYFRPQTEIILNNSNEELFLYDSNEKLIDSVTYSSSENNKSINFYDSEENDSSDEENNEDNSNENNSNYNYDSRIISEKIIFDKPKVIVQSWLDDRNYCYDLECNINFKYDTKGRDLTCYWDFWDDFTIYWCNPKHLKFWKWKHQVTLEVCDENYPDTCKNTFFVFRNLYQKINVEAKITLQWWLTQNQMIKWNTFICDNVDNCSLNLDGRKSSWEDLTYFWNFWNQKYFDWEDPDSIIFEKGFYQIMLEVIDYQWEMDRDFLNLEVTWKNKIIQEESELKENNIGEKDLEENIDKNISDENNISEKTLWQNNSENSEILLSKNYEEIKLKIEVQWQIWQNKELLDDKIICYETCSINFDASNSTWNIEEIFWSFWNWETYSWINPSYINYKNYWLYSVKLTALDKFSREYNSYFDVEFRESKIDNSSQENNSLKEEVDFEELSKTDDNEKKLDEEKIIQEELKEENSFNKNYIIYFLLLVIFWMFWAFLYFFNKKYNYF